MQKRIRPVEGRARETVVGFPSPTLPRAAYLPACRRSHVARTERERPSAAERGRRSCRARTQRSPPQFEIGQRDVATFHRSRSKTRSNASRRLIARSPLIASSGNAVACGVSERYNGSERKRENEETKNGVVRNDERTVFSWR